jgi:short-subunit dehydrogenase
MTNIQGKVLITGAAGGIGTAIARELSPLSSSMLLSARREDQITSLAGELGADTIAADLESREDVARLAAAASSADIAIMNAALPASGDLLEYDVSQIDRALEVNLRAPLVLARLLGEQMAERGGGHIVFISSLAGKAASAGSCLYSATKFGLRGGAIAMRADWSDLNVGISVVCPGFVSDAGMFADSGARLPKGIKTVTPEQVAKGVRKAIVDNRLEVDVAPLPLKLGASFAVVAPAVWEALNRRTGGRKLSDKMSDSQRHKR